RPGRSASKVIRSFSTSATVTSPAPGTPASTALDALSTCGAVTVGPREPDGPSPAAHPCKAMNESTSDDTLRLHSNGWHRSMREANGPYPPESTKEPHRMAKSKVVICP